MIGRPAREPTKRPAHRPRALPDDWVLLQKRDVEGLTGKEIAKLYGVSPQAVSKRFTLMDKPSMTNYRDVLPWKIADQHHSLYAAQRLKAHIKERQGGELSPTAKKRLRDWHERLNRECVVLHYAQVDIGSPWQYVPRTEADEGLVIRWPAGAGPPTDTQRRLLELATEQ